MIVWKTLRRNEMSELISSWKSPEDVIIEPEEPMLPVRQHLVELFHSAKNELGIESLKGSEYKFDLRFGMKLYAYLLEEHGLTAGQAASDGLWVYLSVKVIPDIVFWRWGAEAHSRYYAQSRRIWLKTLWWYVHLSWQGNAASTYKILEHNTTDDIVQLVERSGPLGYRVKLCREIMGYYGSLSLELRSSHPRLLRRVMKLNTARLAVLEPALYEGEEKEYVKDLFSEMVPEDESVLAGGY
jgi:hypothetical protein